MELMGRLIFILNPDFLVAVSGSGVSHTPEWALSGAKGLDKLSSFK